MNIFTHSALILVCISAIACTGTSRPESPIQKDVLAANDEADCRSKGGGWIMNGMGATEKGIRTCHFIHPDEGKPCLDGKDCGSRLCIANLNGKGGTCTKFAKSSFCSFKKIMVNGKSEDERDCVVE